MKKKKKKKDRLVYIYFCFLFVSIPLLAAQTNSEKTTLRENNLIIFKKIISKIFEFF